MKLQSLKPFLLFIMIIGLYACNSEKRKQANQAKPNIIFIMSDDHAMNAISSYGNSVNQNPQHRSDC